MKEPEFSLCTVTRICLTPLFAGICNVGQGESPVDGQSELAMAQAVWFN